MTWLKSIWLLTAISFVLMFVFYKLLLVFIVCLILALAESIKKEEIKHERINTVEDYHRYEDL